MSEWVMIMMISNLINNKNDNRIIFENNNKFLNNNVLNSVITIIGNDYGINSLNNITSVLFENVIFKNNNAIFQFLLDFYSIASNAFEFRFLYNLCGWNDDISESVSYLVVDSIFIDSSIICVEYQQQILKQVSINNTLNKDGRLEVILESIKIILPVDQI